MTARPLVNGASLLGAIGGLVGALQWLKGRRPRGVEVTPDGRRRLLRDGNLHTDYTLLAVEAHRPAAPRSTCRL